MRDNRAYVNFSKSAPDLVAEAAVQPPL